jgi:hypothetical protein
VIRYSLVCDKGHTFESWFQNSKASDGQLKRGLVACPVCDSTKVAKAIMAPQIAATKRKRGKSAAPAEAAAQQPVALLSEKERETRKLVQALHDHVKKNAEHVGDKFPKLARQMHYEEIKPRSIYGEAKAEEVRELIEEGVEIAALPPLPDKGN